MEADMTATNELQNKIRSLLLQEWDPIGVRGVPAASDEYDSYVPPLVKMVMSKKSLGELAEYLLKVEKTEMGLHGDNNRARSVAARLLQLRG
jgi:hypothetical protein